LSKIESGTVTVDADEVMFSSLVETMKRSFAHEVDRRGLSFQVTVDPRLGRTIVSDAKRLQQVLKNLLSNAFKFTEQGGVRLNISPATGGWNQDHRILSQVANVVAFEVSDTGIGIPIDKQKVVFEAFQQADASTSRKYGGTGLGLAISRELSSLLGGEIHLTSTPGVGSTFTLFLPQHYVGPTIGLKPATSRPAPLEEARNFPRLIEAPVEAVPDDRAQLGPDDTSLLIVEDDPHYARIVADLARDSGFKVLVASRGADALELAREFNPSAISLDVFLPDMLGWTVLSHLKQNAATRHIPVQILTSDEDRQHGLARGAYSFITKPTTTEGINTALSRIREYAGKDRRRLLVVEDNVAEQVSIRELLGHDDLDIVTADSGAAALAALADQPCDCMVLDLRLPDMSGFEVLQALSANEALRDMPVVVFTGRELSAEEDSHLHTLARSVVVKGVESPERLLDETALFLHRVVSDLPAEKQRMLERLHRSDDDLVGKTVLVVDDDVRNIFALSSVLERRGMNVLTASNGNEAVSILESRPDLAIVLMDIMMPGMDGYETMRVIRQEPSHRRLPIVALTAKAMKGGPREMPRSWSVRLPRQAGEHGPAAVSAPHVAASMKAGIARMTDQRANILLVDDQPAKLLSYEAVLGELGENLISADSAESALEQLLKNDVAVVLIDVCMPRLDGFELAGMIREHPRFQKLPIIFVSAINLSELDKLKGYESGAVDYVPVPVAPEILRAKVSVFAELHRKTRQLEQLNRELEQRVAERTAELEASTLRLRESEARLQETDRRKDEFSRHAGARAPQPAGADSGGGQAAAHGPSGEGPAFARPRSRRSPGRAPRSPHRRFAGRVAHYARRDHAAPRTRQYRGHRRPGRRNQPAAHRCQAAGPQGPSSTAADLRRRRRDAAHPGCWQPRAQRRQVHRGRRRHRRFDRTCRVRGADPRQGHGHRHPGRHADQSLRPVHAGRSAAESEAGRPRRRPGDGATAGRNAWRRCVGAEWWHRARHRNRRAPADAGRSQCRTPPAPIKGARHDRHRRPSRARGR
jgi:CheY-like chemotaxis protein